MLKNYYKVDENATVSNFLKEINDKKNSQYIILNTNPQTFVDIRTIALKAHNPKEKLKNLKKPLANATGESDDDYLNFLIESGDKIIKTQKSYFDFLDGLKLIKNHNFDFFSKPINESLRKEIFALNEKDKISTARNLLIKKRINLLPVIDKLKLIGEIRTMDFLVNNLVDTTKNKSDFYSEKISDTILNMSISNLINKKPITIDSNKTYINAIELMIQKNLPSLIITKNDELFSIISYKDIFKLFKKDLNDTKYLIEYSGSSQIFDDEFDLIKDYTEKIMNKISKISNYNSLKISLKIHGNKDGTHKKKLSTNLLLSHGNKIIHIDKEIVQGTSDEKYNNKVKGNWNIPQLVQDALFALKKKVIDEKRKF